ncbi:Putative esterase [Sodalis praecaptivus]|uniref:Putative esterase n=1 Tax=Sodalis praecaptivus TaxID=1239307 RepID=W0HWV4_9GAMM|nr:alpha/beta hydrolase-fold protein [Sodalis praecaptivus]AHF76633.1 Putative esterase [Sodalis praecaptivus]
MLKPVIVTLALLMACAGRAAGPRQDITPISDDARRHFTFAQINLQFAAQAYRLYIATPKSPAPAAGYPVLYLLDGNAHFPLAVNQYRPANGPAPLIVAIGYPSDLAYPLAERTRDYTFAPADGGSGPGGGAAQFYQFLHDQVQPLIAAHYPVDSRRMTLAGHSFGGLFTLYVLFNHPRAFQRYVAASPSLWWNNGAVLPHRQPLVTAAPTSVTLTVGEYEEKPDPRHSADGGRQSQLRGRQQVTRARALAEHLQRDGVNSHFILFPGKDHGGVIPDAIDQALRVASAP